MSEHTKGRLSICGPRWPGDNEAALIICNEAGSSLGIMSPGDPFITMETGIANARRLVAGWNACEGIPTEPLERAAASGDAALFGQQLMEERDAIQRRAEAAEGDMAAAERDRDELLALAKSVSQYFGNDPIPEKLDADIKLRDTARDLIAKHTPKAPA